MKPEYVTLKHELLEHALSKYVQPRDTISIPYLLKGRCDVRKPGCIHCVA